MLCRQVALGSAVRAIYEQCERDVCVVRNKLDARGHFCGAFLFSFVLIPTVCLSRRPVSAQAVAVLFRSHYEWMARAVEVTMEPLVADCPHWMARAGEGTMEALVAD